MHTLHIGRRLIYNVDDSDGTENYHWYVAYPGLKASLDAKSKTAHTWCEVTIKYSEQDVDKNPASDYNLRLHKNGSRIISTYALDDGVTAKWQFTYYPEDDDEVSYDCLVHSSG